MGDKSKNIKMFYLNAILSFVLFQLTFVLSNQIVEMTFNEFLDNIPNNIQSRYNDKVTIDIFYESLCPDCRVFDNKQLVPVIEKLSNNIVLHTYPYGNAHTMKRDGKYEITCQHGPKECYGNRLHACAIDVIQNVTEAVLFNACMMESWQKGRGSDDLAADVCGQRKGLSAKPIKKCAKSQHGFDLLKHYGDLSQDVKYTFVPWILVNGVQSNGTDFMSDVCRAFKNPPRACDSYVYDEFYFDVENVK